MKCCMCGMPYEPQDRVVKYFSFFDNEIFEVKTTDHIDIEGMSKLYSCCCFRDCKHEKEQAL